MIDPPAAGRLIDGTQSTRARGVYADINKTTLDILDTVEKREDRSVRVILPSSNFILLPFF